MTKPTTYVSFTSKGGRIGRWKWTNATDEVWGFTSWDSWWPRPSALRWSWPAGETLVKAFSSVASAAQEASNSVKRLGVSVQRLPLFAATMASLIQPAEADRPMPSLKLSVHEASLLVWAIEQLPKATTRNAHESKSVQLFNLYEKLHLFADRNDHVAP